LDTQRFVVAWNEGLEYGVQTGGKTDHFTEPGGSGSWNTRDKYWSVVSAHFFALISYKYRKRYFDDLWLPGGYP